MRSSDPMKESRNVVTNVTHSQKVFQDHQLTGEDQKLLRSLSPRGRRYLLLLFAFIACALYLPRLARMQTYIKVTHKIDSVLPKSEFTYSLDRSLQVFENNLKSKVQKDFLFPNNALLSLNVYLENLNCDQEKLTGYALNRLKALTEADPEFERLCKGPLQAEYKKQKQVLRQLQLDQLGITADGKVRLMPGDSVLLAGDSLMQGPAALLVSSLKDKGLVPINRSQISTGLAYPEFFDWPNKIIHSIDRENVKLVVVFLGANDTFDMYLGGKTLKVGSPEWLGLYRSRVEKISDHARLRQVPLIWMGLPAMNRSDIQPYVGQMNEIYKSAVESHDGIYIDSALALGGSQNRYNSTMTHNGKTIKVRSSDGVHFTVEGWSILANTVLNKLKT